MSFAPPIARDGFHYNGDLYVEVGNLNRHKRASIPEITAILRPDLKPSKANAAASPIKDPVGHWYEAQLIHYGLPPSKDKARAKMRLLEALNTSKLVVPAGIAKLETELKKDYAAADRKAKAQYKAQMASSGKSDLASVSKKRKEPVPTNSINVNINFGSYAGAYLGNQMQTMPDFMAGANGVSMPHADSPAAKKPKTAAAAKSKGSNAPKQGDVQTVKKEPKPKATSAPKKATSKKEPDESLPRSVRPIPTARWSGPTRQAAGSPAPEKKPPTKKETAVKQEPTSNTAMAARPKQTARRSVPVKSESSPKKAPAVKKEPSVKRESSTQQELYSPNKPKLGLINGYYEISCPKIEYEWPDYADNMSLILCLDTPGVWGSYDFGMFSGILHLNERPWNPSHDPILCSWRGRDNGEGEMIFGGDCVGEIAFLGDGRIEGYLSLYGICEFTGMRVPGPGSAPRNAASMRQEWDGYNDSAYEEERANRW